MGYELRTKRDYDFYEVASALQKSIRRADETVAGYFAMELFASGFSKYCWKRLLTISAEDVEEPVTREILALHSAFEMINDKANKEKGRIFISKAVIILCRAVKSRDPDHLQNLVYDKKIGITDQEIESMLKDASEYTGEVPEYTFDIHTKKGRKMGKTKKQFFLEEDQALFPRSEDLQFDNHLQEYLEAM